MSSRPAAPSRPMPVSRQAAAAAPYSRATDSNSTSTDGRHEWRSGSCVRRSRPSRTTRWRSGGAITTRPACAATRLAVARVGARGGASARRASRRRPARRARRCAARAGSAAGNRGGSAAQDVDDRAGPPVDAPIATTSHALRSRLVRARGRQRAAVLRKPAAVPRGCVITRMRDTSFTVAMKRRSHAPSGSSPVRLLEHVDRAGGQRLVGLEQLAAVGRRRDDQDRRRAVRHDVLGGGQPAHHRQHHVHRDDVGPQRLGTARSRACRRSASPTTSTSGSAASTSQAAAHGQRVLDDEDADLAHRLRPPIA